MVTDAVHDLPLPVREPCKQQEISERVLLVVDKVVADAHQPHHQGRTQQTQPQRLVPDSGRQTDQPQNKDNQPIDFRDSFILDLVDLVLLEDPSLEGPVEAILLEGVPGDLFGAVPYVIFLEEVPCSLFPQVVDHKVLCDVLAFGEPDPALASWVLVDEFGQVVVLVLDDPVFGGGQLPELLIPCGFLFHPDGWRRLEAPGGQRLHLWGGRHNGWYHNYKL